MSSIFRGNPEIEISFILVNVGNKPVYYKIQSTTLSPFFRIGEILRVNYQRSYINYRSCNDMVFLKSHIKLYVLRKRRLEKSQFPSRMYRRNAVSLRKNLRKNIYETLKVCTFREGEARSLCFVPASAGETDAASVSAQTAASSIRFIVQPPIS